MTATPALLTPTQPQLTPESEALFYAHVEQVRNVASVLMQRIPTHFAQSEGEDLHMLGLMALWKAAMKFDPANSAGASFWAYAHSRVRGAMLDELRKRDFIPRRVRARLRKVTERVKEMELELCRSVTREEAALALGFSPREIHEISAASDIGFTSLNRDREEGEEGSGTVADVIGDDRVLHPSVHLDQEEDGVSLEACLDQLTEIERSIVRLYYFNGLQLKVIAGCVGLTESRACQIMDATMIKLRKLMERQRD